MINTMATGSSEEFQHLLHLFSSQAFLNQEGLGNEVPFFICPCDPRHAVSINRMVNQLVNRLKTKGVHALKIDLYDISIALLEKNGDLEWYIEHESSITKSQLIEDIQGVLDTRETLIPAIAQKMSECDFDVMFLTGVGEVFPFIRSHNVLNNLQSTAKAQPTVMFFPGAYAHSPEKGASLNLFSRLRDDKYYRAFNVFDCEV